MSTPNGRVWKPLNVGGLRLYRVVVTLGPLEQREYVVAARMPREAARLISACYTGTPEASGNMFYSVTGYALDVYQPADWWRDGVPCIHDGDRFTAAARGLVAEHAARQTP